MRSSCREVILVGSREPQIRCESRPSRSLGSNHVDLGGMIPPASDTRIRSSTDTGKRENATANLPESTSSFEFPRAADPADEVDPLVGAYVFDAKHGIEDQRSRADRRRGPVTPKTCPGRWCARRRRGRPRLRRAGWRADGPPSRTVSRRLSEARNSVAVRPCRSRTTRLYGRTCIWLSGKATANTRSCSPAPRDVPRPARAGRAGCPMMAIGDVQAWHRGKRRHDRGVFGRRRPPHLVANRHQAP